MIVSISGYQVKLTLSEETAQAKYIFYYLEFIYALMLIIDYMQSKFFSLLKL